MSPDRIVIVGGGHAGAQLCAALVDAGQGARVHLLCDEAQLPYQRPPLSKSYLKSAAEALQLHRPESWFAEHGVKFVLGGRVVAIDRAAKRVTLENGASLDYAVLVLATGSRARRLPTLPEPLENVVVLRSAADASTLRERLCRMLQAQQRLTVLGGGFIGLEIAATARHLGLQVQVLEGASRLLARSVSSGLAEHVRVFHESAGTELRLGAKVDGFETRNGKLAGMQVDAVYQPVDQMVLGIGAVPNTDLAEAAGLAVDNGVVVDASLRTSDPSILAVGDCASFPWPGGGHRRLESVQNATDQAKAAAASILGRDEPYGPVPWFWSEQGGLRIQIAGVLPALFATHRRPGADAHSFSLFHYDNGQLVCIESVNAPVDHMFARKLLATRKNPLPEQVCNSSVQLKSLL